MSDRLRQVGNRFVNDQRIDRELRSGKYARSAGKQQYLNAIITAREAGWTNQRIGNVLGVSEAAIRRILGRKK